MLEAVGHSEGWEPWEGSLLRHPGKRCLCSRGPSAPRSRVPGPHRMPPECFPKTVYCLLDSDFGSKLLQGF